jgi:putative ATP-dependent endonuclease of OLD family
MFISKIEIDNYRNFKPAKEIASKKVGRIIEFVEGTNIIIGHNNAGKTNLIKAIQLVLDSRKAKNKLTIDDFCKEYSDFSKPPEINISLTFKEQKGESEDDKVVVHDWYTATGDLYEAQLTFSFFLPQGDDYKSYCDEIKELEKDGKYDSGKAWGFIKKYYFSKYIAKVYGGRPEKKETADYEMLEKFDFQFLDAIRDAEKQMFFGSNTILKEVLNYFLDFDLIKGKKLKDLSEEIQKQLRKKEENFEKDSHKLFKELKERISKDQILKYSENTGANKGGKPDLDAHVIEEDLLFALRLIVQIGKLKIPISNNGLGYNNLLYAALVLAKMQIESESSYYGENAKVFPVLAIEEPEAHLHPSLQFKFLKFLNENIDKEKKVRQLFVTTHSTHITSAAELDNIICLYNDTKGNSSIGYPGKAFGDKLESKNYVKRFLDATKSNMLFADKVIFVEGLAEQLLLPAFGAYDFFDKEKNITNEDELINQHISIISVDSRTFKHFLHLYSFSEKQPFAINKKVICITDSDPEAQGGDNKWRACFPFQLKGTTKFKALATHVSELKNEFDSKYNNISVAHPIEGFGKTLEYELARYNAQSELIITDCFPLSNSPHTAQKFKKVQTEYIKDKKAFSKVLDVYETFMESDKQKKYFGFLKAQISASSFSDEEKSAALIATIYYNIVKNLKGEHAMFLEKKLRDNLTSGVPQLFVIPKYIKDAITEILK